MSLSAVGFVGGGNMATAIIRGLEAAYPNISIHVCDAVPAVRDIHISENRHVYDNVKDLLKACSQVILAVKPQHYSDIVNDLSDALNDQLVISIIAGLTLDKMQSGLGAQAKIIRSMPNTPMAIGEGMVALSPGSNTNDQDIQTATEIFSVAAKVLVTTEEKMNAITAVSGSGPAYFFHFCEVLLAAAKDLGFNDDEAKLLVSQTAAGSINYLCSQEGFPAAQLREQVTSKGGTTAAALAVFSEHDLAGIARQALQAAEKRGHELAEQA